MHLVVTEEQGEVHVGRARGRGRGWQAAATRPPSSASPGAREQQGARLWTTSSCQGCQRRADLPYTRVYCLVIALGVSLRLRAFAHSRAPCLRACWTGTRFSARSAQARTRSSGRRVKVAAMWPSRKCPPSTTPCVSLSFHLFTFCAAWRHESAVRKRIVSCPTRIRPDRRFAASLGSHRFSFVQREHIERSNYCSIFTGMITLSRCSTSSARRRS